LITKIKHFKFTTVPSQECNDHTDGGAENDKRESHANDDEQQDEAQRVLCCKHT